jgi:hypothetical protein
LFLSDIAKLQVDFIWHYFLSFLKKLNESRESSSCGNCWNYHHDLVLVILSYAKKNRDFRASVVGKMVFQAFPQITKKDPKVVGWILHCSTGLAFTMIYKIFLEIRS